MDLLGVFEFVHQLRKCFGLNISREHGVINHDQRFGAKFKILPDLACAVLKPDNLSGTVRCSPKVGTMIQSKLDKRV